MDGHPQEGRGGDRDLQQAALFEFMEVRPERLKSLAEGAEQLSALFLLFLVCRLRPASYGWIDGFVLDIVDAGAEEEIDVPCLVTGTVMRSLDDRVRLGLGKQGELARRRGAMSVVRARGAWGCARRVEALFLVDTE